LQSGGVKVEYNRRGNISPRHKNKNLITLRFQAFHRKPRVYEVKKRVGGSVLFVYGHILFPESTVCFHVLQGSRGPRWSVIAAVRFMFKVVLWFILEKLAKLPTCLLMALTQLMIAVTDAFIALHNFLLTRLVHAAIKRRKQGNKTKNGFLHPIKTFEGDNRSQE